MNFYGLAIAVVTFLIIGAFHPIVIKAEYHFTYRCWPVFLAAGLILIGISVFINAPVISCILGVTGCSCLWSIKELKEQHGRVERGWFPVNPARSGKSGNSGNSGESGPADRRNR